MPTQAEIVVGYQAATKKIRDEHRAYVLALWSSLASYREPDIARMLTMLIPRALGAQRTIAQMTEVYAAALGGFDPRPIDELRVTGAALRGVEPEDVYRRPARTIYNALAEGKPFEEAVERGRRRMESIAMTDLQLAMRAQEQESYADRGWEWYRRILTGEENCALCILASTQRYRVGNLKPMHPGCDCESAPGGSASDPGQIINAERLEQIHELLGGDTTYNRSGRSVKFPDGTVRSYKDVIVREHGEYGPTLTWRGHKHTGPDDVAAA